MNQSGRSPDEASTDGTSVDDGSLDERSTELEPLTSLHTSTFPELLAQINASLLVMPRG